ncbi:MAG: class I SAM-dependent methyltransferase [Planctomycetota bacterium]
MSAHKARYPSALASFREAHERLPLSAWGCDQRIRAALRLTCRMEMACTDFNADPWEPLVEDLRLLAEEASAVGRFDNFTDGCIYEAILPEDREHEVSMLFAEAWTTYSSSTYDHSMELIRKRFDANRMDAAFFKGKSAFDGGCGTGRLSLVMAERGARVKAWDQSAACLKFAQTQAQRHKLAVDFTEHTVTQLEGIPDNSIDVVVSNGVLHHTVDCLGGVKEHFRATKKGGVFWLYLYGKGGFYWVIYDVLKSLLAPLGPVVVKETLTRLRIREGLIYTLLDNCMAPIRTYHSVEEVRSALGNGPLKIVLHKGSSPIDDTQMLLDTRYGRDLLGPEGEVRINILK